jgi:hypothetical protein
MTTVALCECARYGLRKTHVELRNGVAVDRISIGLVIAAHGEEACYVDCQPIRRVSLSFFHLSFLFIS